MKKLFSISITALTSIVILASSYAPIVNANATEVDNAKDLTTLLRAGRAVTVNKTLIGNPSKYKVDSFVKRTKKYYKNFSGNKLDESNVMLGKLMESMKQVIIKAKAGDYKDKWPTGSYANKFLPARFARESALAFNKASGGKATIKLTTSNELLVNTDNKADSWETSAIEGKFKSSGWEKGKAYSEKTAEGFRLILPEYYISGCMSCHGGNTGKELHPGNIEGVVGELGGAISVVLN